MSLHDFIFAELKHLKKNNDDNNNINNNINKTAMNFNLNLNINSSSSSSSSSSFSSSSSSSSSLNFDLNLLPDAPPFNMSALFSSTDARLTTVMWLYCYATPLLIVVGVLGNVLSLRVFLSRSMRRLEASVYLSALSLSDLAALLCYVLVDWLRRGLPYLGTNHSAGRSETVFDIEGLCQVQMYMSYVTRFLSAWIIVIFTVERYVAVCHPLKRRGLIFGTRSSYKILPLLLVLSLILMTYKPILTQRTEHAVRGIVIGRCSRSMTHPLLSFVLDSIFALSITLLPFLIITFLNTLIILRLYNRHRRIRTHIMTEEILVRMEFTILFLVISLFFIALNLPFFSVWCNRFLKSFYNSKSFTVEYSEVVHVLTRLIFYLNYSINFFLYSVSGACFRRELRMMFLSRKSRQSTYSACSLLTSHSGSDNSKLNIRRRSWV